MRSIRKEKNFVRIAAMTSTHNPSGYAMMSGMGWQGFGSLLVPAPQPINKGDVCQK